MVFSSITFLFYFLPAFFLIYFLAGQNLRNFVLLFFSLVFYAWGETEFVFVLLLSILMNYGFALLIGTRNGWARSLSLGAGVAANLIVLGVFKYADFFAENANALLGLALDVPHIKLPLGISFFTFHSLSYLIDVARRRVKPNPRLEQVAVYITMFPQLVAGPIVRYSTVSKQIARRRTTLGRISAGLRIFVIGLAWKVLIADQVAPIAATVFDTLKTPALLEAWLGLVAYATQIYFDFGGYSNMAIGLGIALGFRFPRNFRLPYTSRSITEFWRRWHISLSTWFRDYLYIPLGGSRVSPLRTYLNLWTVFLICGLWHGASWTFVIWGIHHGCLLAIERAGLSRVLARAWPVAAHAYAILAILAGWVWFRAESLPRAQEMFAALLGANGVGPLSMQLHLVLIPASVGALVIGGLSSLGLWPRRSWLGNVVAPPIGISLDNVAVGTVLILCLLSVGAGSYSPFLYFRF